MRTDAQRARDRARYAAISASPEAKAKRDAYMAAYRAEHKARLAEADKTYCAKRKVTETPEQAATRRAANAVKSRRWAEANPGVPLALTKRYYATERGKATNVKNSAIRRARTAPLTEFDRWVTREAAELAQMRTRLLGFPWDVEHIVPVSRGGTGVGTNLQVAPRVWNQAKGNRHAERFLGAYFEGA